MWIEDIQTQFVRDRVKETAFADREYVHDLYLIEQLQRGHSLGWAFHMSGGAKRLFARYPAEAEGIRLELAEGQYVDPTQFNGDYRRLAAAWTAREKAKAVARQGTADRAMAEQQVKQAATLQREREVWQQMAGAS